MSLLGAYGYFQEQVQSNKDLDLPTQQELLAQFRCDEIAGVALAEFNDQAKSQRRPIEAGKVVDGLGEMMRQWKKTAISECFKRHFLPLADLQCQHASIRTHLDTIKVFIAENVRTC